MDEAVHHQVVGALDGLDLRRRIFGGRTPRASTGELLRRPGSGRLGMDNPTRCDAVCEQDQS